MGCGFIFTTDQWHVWHCKVLSDCGWYQIVQNIVFRVYICWCPVAVLFSQCQLLARVCLTSHEMFIFHRTANKISTCLECSGGGPPPFRKICFGRWYVPFVVWPSPCRIMHAQNTVLRDICWKWSASLCSPKRICVITLSAGPIENHHRKQHYVENRGLRCTNTGQ